MVCLPVYCLDSELDAPSASAAYIGFDKEDPSGSGCLSEILSSLEDVDFSQLAYSHLSNIQDVIWTCRDDGSIGLEEWDFLESLPRISTAYRSASGNTEVKSLKKKPGFWKSPLGF